MSRTALPVAILLVLLGGCGGSGSSEPPGVQAVRTTVDNWLASLETPKQHGDNARACSYLTPFLQHSIDEQLRVRGEHANCKTFASKWTGGSNPPGRLGAHVTTISVSGRKATATLKAPPDRESDVQLQFTRGRWLINNY